MREFTFILPCLDEEKTLPFCIKEILTYIKNNKLNAEILVSDNGSIDNSVQIAKRNGARVSIYKEKGYGNALINGINNAHGKYCIMGDCDGSYDFSNLDEFIDKVRNGYDLVVGNRFAGGIEKNAMPLSHKIGVKFLSGFANLFFRTKIKDFHCGLRVYNTDGTITTIGNESTNSSIKSASHSSLLNNSTVYNVVIFICFQDENPATVFTDAITSNIYNKFMGNSNSLKDYYLSLSYGSFSVDSLFALRDKENNVYFVYQDIYTRSHYTSIKTQNGTKRYNAEAPLLNRALTAADAYLDYTGIDLDLNNDNYVDSVSFVVSGKFSSLAWGE